MTSKISKLPLKDVKICNFCKCVYEVLCVALHAIFNSAHARCDVTERVAWLPLARSVTDWLATLFF